MTNKKSKSLDFRLGFRLLGDDINPSAITKYLEKEPTKSWKRGEIASLPDSPDTRIRQTGLWAITSQGSCTSFQDTLDDFLQVIGINEDLRKVFPEIEVIRVSALIMKDIGVDGNVSIEYRLTVEQCRRIFDLGADLSFEIVGLKPEDL